MKKDKKITVVRFYKEKDSEDVFAYFPFMKHCDKFKACYAHIGQHSACSPYYVKECKRANYSESKDLREELESIGYNFGDHFVIDDGTTIYAAQKCDFPEDEDLEILHSVGSYEEAVKLAYLANGESPED